MAIALKALACALLVSWAWIAPSLVAAVAMARVTTQANAFATQVGMAMIVP
jgi:hypothetical protein